MMTTSKRAPVPPLCLHRAPLNQDHAGQRGVPPCPPVYIYRGYGARPDRDPNRTRVSIGSESTAPQWSAQTQTEAPARLR